MRRSEAAAIVVLVAFLAGGLVLLGLFRVQEGEHVVVVRFGEGVRVVKEPGVHVRMPLIEQLVTIDAGTIEFRPEFPMEVQTADGQRLIVHYVVQYRIAEPLKFFATVRTKEGLEPRVGVISFSAFRSVLREQAAAKIERNATRATMARDIIKRIAAQVKDFGLSIVGVQFDTQVVEW